MKERLLIGIVAVILIGNLFEMKVQAREFSAASVIDSGNCGENLTYRLDEKGTLFISGTGRMYDWEWGKAPWFNKRNRIQSVRIEKGVTGVGRYAFCKCEKLSEVRIPEGVTSINWAAFGWCSSLREIELPESVESIYGGAFCGCSQLKNINVKEANRNFCSKSGILFSKDKKVMFCYPAGRTEKSYMIPAEVNVVETCAFYNCGYLEEININQNVTGIRDSAFDSCSNLKRCSFPKALRSWEKESWQGAAVL